MKTQNPHTFTWFNHSIRPYWCLLLILSLVQHAQAQFQNQFPGGNFLRVWMVNATHARFQATVPNNQYFSIGFGKTMTNTDMVLWIANGNSSTTSDLWSTGRSTPARDAIQDYQTVFTANSSHVEFTSDRPLTTGDTR